MAQILIRGTEELKKTINSEAARLGVSTNALILFILKEWVDRNDIKGEQK